MPKASDPNPRKLALDALLRIESGGSYSNLALDALLKKYALSPADRRLFTVLVYGVTEHRLTLDYLIQELSDRPFEKLDPTVKNILRIGLYQLLFLDRIPDHAAVSESVSLCTRRTAGFVNACLRAFLRCGKQISFPDRSQNPERALSVAYSVPEPLVSRFLEEFGMERTESLFRAFQKRPPLTLALNRLRVPSRDDYLRTLRLAGIEGIPSDYTEYGILIPSPPPIDQLPGYAEGLFYIQDEASQICVEALGALPGETVIDACACPGSKSFGSAIRMKNCGRVLSFDLHENKLSLVRKGAERLGIPILSASVHDGKVFDESLYESADRVLCDVPCSGYGVIGKKPDIRYKDPGEMDRLPDVQFAILENCARYVKKGGVLVYSTCTVFSAENWFNVRKFLAVNPQFSTEEFTVGPLSSEGGMLSLFPDRHGTDGFFLAKLRRTD